MRPERQQIEQDVIYCVCCNIALLWGLGAGSLLSRSGPIVSQIVGTLAGRLEDGLHGCLELRRLHVDR
jgi:hypothetical protein